MPKGNHKVFEGRTRACTPEPCADPLVFFLHAQLIINGMTRDELARRAGVSTHTLDAWWRPSVSAKKRSAHVTSRVTLGLVRNCLEVFGYGLKPSILKAKSDG